MFQDGWPSLAEDVNRDAFTDSKCRHVLTKYHQINMVRHNRIIDYGEVSSSVYRVPYVAFSLINRCSPAVMTFLLAYGFAS